MEQTPLKKYLFVEVAVIRILTVVFQLLFLKIYTNSTSLYQIGIYLFLLTISYSLNAFLLVPLDYFQQSQVYNLKNSRISLKSYTGINIWILKLSAMLFISCEIGCYFFNPSYCKVIPIIALLALSGYFVNLLRGFINNLEQRRAAIYFLLLEGVLKIVLFFVLNHFFQSSAILILIALLGASVLTLITLYIFFKKLEEYNYHELKSFDMKEVFSFSYPISVGAVINWIQLQGYRMILVPLGLVEVVGIYGTVANVGTSGMNAYATIFGQLFVPNLYKTHGAYIKVYIRNAVLSILFVLVTGYYLSDYIVGILTKHDFVKYASLIVYGILSEGGNFLIGALIIYLTIHKLTMVSIKVNLVGLIVFFLSFYSLYYFKYINIYTVGLPIVITQLVIVSYLMIVVFIAKKSNEHIKE